MASAMEVVCPARGCGHLIVLHDITSVGKDDSALICKVCFANGRMRACKHTRE
jgi:hypothetical protein